MSRSRTLTATAASVMAHAMIQEVRRREAREPVGTKAVEKIAQDQRDVLRQNRYGRTAKLNAVKALVEVSQGQIVLGHIHPRWVRRAVKRILDMGHPVTLEDVEKIRHHEPIRLTMVGKS